MTPSLFRVAIRVCPLHMLAISGPVDSPRGSRAKSARKALSSWAGIREDTAGAGLRSTAVRAELHREKGTQNGPSCSYCCRTRRSRVRRVPVSRAEPAVGRAGPVFLHETVASVALLCTSFFSPSLVRWVHRHHTHTHLSSPSDLATFLLEQKKKRKSPSAWKGKK